MYVAQAIVSVIGLIALFWASRRSLILSSTLLFFLFWFAHVAFELSAKMTTFYLFGLVFMLLVKLYLGKKYNTQSDSGFVGGTAVKGFAFEIFSVVVAIGLFVSAILLSAQKGQIMGVLPLAVESANPVTARLTLIFSPLISGALGIIENGVFFGLFLVLAQFKEFFSFFFGLLVSPIPVLGQLLQPFFRFLEFVMPFVFACLMFGVFHVVAYLFDWSKMLWAAVMMAFMLGSYFITNRDTTAADLFHFGWNNLLTSKESLSIVV